MTKSEIIFEENKDTGYCLTKCPWGRDCYVNSLSCSECMHNFGVVRDGVLKCSGCRLIGKVSV